jgi:hypothetical protein
MRAQNLEDVIPGLREARERERLNRSLAFVSAFTWTVCGTEIVHLTPRHRLELRMTGNAFGHALLHPMKGDVFQFLWRLNPAYSRKLKFHPLALICFMALWIRVKFIDVELASRQIHRYLADMIQDLPEEALENETIPTGEQDAVCSIAQEAHFFLSNFPNILALDGKSYMDTPYLVLQQLARAHRLANDENPRFINESDSIATAFFKDRLAENRLAEQK